MHGAPFPCGPGKASLLLACAHGWEASPFIQEMGLRLCCRPYLPYPLYEGSLEGKPVALLVSGSGRARAGQAVAALLSHSLRDAATASGAGLSAPPWVVANFGTCGAYAGTWPVGTTLLVSKVRCGSGESLYPERMAPWADEEAECRTVDAPQATVLSDDRPKGRPERRPLFDMEAFGVAEAAALYLSTAHLVVGKCVSDWIGPPMEARALDIKGLKACCGDDYQAGAKKFLQHALAHCRLLSEDTRRIQALRIAEVVAECLAVVNARLPLTVTQQRELAQALRARATVCEGALLGQQIEGWLSAEPPCGKKEGAKRALARLLDKLSSPS